MKKTMLICSLVLLSGIIFYSCGPDDQKLQKEVNTALSASLPQISSAVKSGVVTLTGVVESDAAKESADQLAKSVKGVKSVVNNIEVKLPPPPVVENPDDTMKSLISEALSTGGFKDLTIAVANGEVTLSGNVKKADLKKVLQIANDAKPTKVINNLTVK